MELVKLYVKGSNVEILDGCPVPAQAVGAKISFCYGPEWDGLRRNVVIKGSATVCILDAGDTVAIPQEAVAEPAAKLLVGVCGTNADNTLVIPTVWAELGPVRSSAMPEGDTVGDPTLPVWAQLLERMAVLEESGAGGDLSGYARKTDLPTKVSQLQNDKGYLTAHQDISGKLDASALPGAINTALAQAKASGAFDGEDGAKGEKGDKGDPGPAGTSVTVKSVSESTADGGSNVVTFSDGTTVTIKNGSKGSEGATGAAGSAGKNSTDGYTPVRGTDYWTEEDKTEIVKSVIEALGGNPVFGIVDEDNNIIVSGDLADGTYSVKYEMANGSTVNIGNLVLDNNVYYTVTNTLTNCTNSNSATKAAQGSAYSATIAAKSGYELKTVTVTMGGSPVTVSGGTISIASVTGNIVITAVAEEIQAAYTNLADPTSSEWLAGHRLNSAGVPAEDAENVHVTNFIGPLNDGDIIYIQGMDMTSNITMPANANKAVTAYGAAKLTVWNDGDPASNPVASTTGGQLQIDKTSTVKYWRFSGKLNGTANDVIITINEPIV